MNEKRFSSQDLGAVLLIFLLTIITLLAGGYLAFKSYEEDLFLNEVLQALVPINITAAIGLGTIAISVSKDSFLRHILPMNIVIIILTGVFSLLISFIDTPSGYLFTFKRVYFFYNILLLTLVTVETILRVILAPKKKS